MVQPRLIDTYQAALDFLNDRIGLGVQPGLERMSGALDLMTSPHESFPTLHVAGTNGKTTTVRLIDAILHTAGMRTGTYVSPHLHSIEQRYTLGRETLTRTDFVQAVTDVASFIEHYETTHGTSLTYFEATVAVAFQAFASAGVDVAVVEVGLGGRLDATNVVDADVSVVTGIAKDHMEYLGETIGAIAREKVAILKAGGVLVTGPLAADAEDAMRQRVEETESTWVHSGRDFSPDNVIRAVGGWHCAIDGVHARYEDLYLPIHGRHQVDHLATAVATVEMFYDRPLGSDELTLAIASVTSPGRLEIASRRPLVLLDGAHNAQGLEGLAIALKDEFPQTNRVLLAGFRGERRVASLLAPLTSLFDQVIATAADDDPQAIPAEDVAAEVRLAFGESVPVETITPIARALTEARHRVEEDDMLVVSGSLYVISEVRGLLGEADQLPG